MTWWLARSEAARPPELGATSLTAVGSTLHRAGGYTVRRSSRRTSCALFVAEFCVAGPGGWSNAFAGPRHGSIFEFLP